VMPLEEVVEGQALARLKIARSNYDQRNSM
jgi:hypothetical protein